MKSHRVPIQSGIDQWPSAAKPAERPFAPHALRSTVKSHVRARCVPRDISKMCLNHQLLGVEGIYGRHTHLEEWREGLGKWAELLVRLRLA